MANKLESLRVLFLDLPRFWKLCVSVSVDAFLCFITVVIAFFLRIGSFSAINYPILLATYLSIAFAIPLFFYFGSL